MYAERYRALERAAKQHAITFVSEIQQPIAGLGPFGQFTLVQLLSVEFALDLPSHLPAETLSKSHSSISASAVQTFARLIKADKAFSGVAELRMHGERPISDFALLHLRAQAAVDNVTQLLQRTLAKSERCAWTSCRLVFFRRP